MALIHCPECDKDVSDTAKICPHCGYDIQSYVLKKNAAEELNSIAHDNAQRVQEIIQNAEKQVEPLTKSHLYESIFGMSFCGVGFILSCIGGMISPLIAALGAPCFAFLCAIFFFQFNKRKKELELSQSDYAAYKKTVIEKVKNDAEAHYQKDFEKKQAEKQTVHLQCPVCNSTNVMRITTTDRVVTSMIVGVAGKNIGKQYMCRNCQHQW